MSQTVEKLTERRRRAIYRASHRGTKEMDLVLGRFAAANVEAMDEQELGVFERLLTLPDPDLNQWTMFGSPNAQEADLSRLFVRIRQFHGLES